MPCHVLPFPTIPCVCVCILQTKVSEIPSFLIKGTLNRTNCPLSSPFTGEITVVHSAAKIRSIELQLVRVETIGEHPDSDLASTPRPVVAQPVRCVFHRRCGHVPGRARTETQRACITCMDVRALACSVRRRHGARGDGDPESAGGRRRRVPGARHPALHDLPSHLHVPDEHQRRESAPQGRGWVLLLPFIAFPA